MCSNFFALVILVYNQNPPYIFKLKPFKPSSSQQQKV